MTIGLAQSTTSDAVDTYNRQVANLPDSARGFLGDENLHLYITDTGEEYAAITVIGVITEFEDWTDSDADGNHDPWFAQGKTATMAVYVSETKLEEMGGGILRLGADGRYRHTDLDLDYIEVDGVKYDIPSGSVSSAKLELREWQIALAASYQIDQFIPYVGGKYSDLSGDAKTTVSGTEYKSDLDSDNNFGVFVGADLLVNDSAVINVEGRFIDETALSGGATIRF